MSPRGTYDIKRTVAEFIREHRNEVAAVFALALSAPIAGVLLPKFYGTIIDAFSKSRQTGLRADTKQVIKGAVAMVVVHWALLQVMYMGLDHLDSVLVPQLLEHVRKHIVLDVIETYKTDHQALELGDLVAKIVKLPLIIQDLAHQVRSFFLPAVLVGLAVGAYLFWVDPLLGAVFAANVAALVATICKFGAACAGQSSRMQTEDDTLHEEISDILDNLLNVYAGAGLEIELARLEKQHHTLGVEFSQTIRCASRFKRVYNLLTFGMFLSVNAASFYLYSKKRVGLDHVVAIMMATLFFSDRLSGIGDEIRDFVFDLGVVRNVQGYLDTLKARQSASAANSGGVDVPREPFTIERGAITFDDVSVVRGELPVFERLRLEVPARHKVALVGRNGSGKSTLTKLVLGLMPYTGTVAIDGRDIRTLDPAELRRQIIYIPQTPKLFNRSVYDNIVYGVKGASKARVRATLARYGLDGVLGRKLDARVGKNGENLSGGQRQIVYLLRCALRCEGEGAPVVVVMDEPTAALDSDKKALIFQVLETIMEGKTVLFVTHDEFLLGFADRVVDVEQL